MSENTKIEWADHSWSPWRGCTKVSPGCANCYAETLSKRNPAVLGQWGKGKPRVLAKNWNDPMRWNREAAEDLRCDVCGATREDDLVNADGFCGQCEHHAWPEARRVFPSLCDWLDDEVPIEWLARFLTLIHSTQNLDWLLLTKRPENFGNRLLLAAQEITDCAPDVALWLALWRRGQPPANVWFGVSVEDKIRADERIPILLQIPAVVRWLSLEPLLGPVDLTEAGSKVFAAWSKLHWLVIGGESGHGARPCNVEWVRSLKDQGKHAGVPVFVKQLGANPHCDCGELPAGGNAEMMHPKGGDPSEWPADLRVREFPEVKP